MTNNRTTRQEKVSIKKVIHKLESALIDLTDESELWSTCGLGKGKRELVELDGTRGKSKVTCKTCLKAINQQ
jgi:hypothetical protein